MKMCLWDKVVGHVLEKKLSWPPGGGVDGICVPSWVALGPSMWGLKQFGEGGKKLGWARPLLERTSSAQGPAQVWARAPCDPGSAPGSAASACLGRRVECAIPVYGQFSFHAVTYNLNVG